MGDKFPDHFLLLIIIQKTPPSYLPFFSLSLRKTLFYHHTLFHPWARSDYFKFLFFAWRVVFKSPWNSGPLSLSAWPQFQPYPHKPELFPFSKYALFPIDFGLLNSISLIKERFPPLSPSPKVNFSLSFFDSPTQVILLSGFPSHLALTSFVILLMSCNYWFMSSPLDCEFCRCWGSTLCFILFGLVQSFLYCGV